MWGFPAAEKDSFSLDDDNDEKDDVCREEEELVINRAYTHTYTDAFLSRAEESSSKLNEKWRR